MVTEILDRLLVATPCPPGSGCTFTWTLVSKFGEMLEEVEQFFGSRNHEYTILGIEFSGTIPQIWFPRDRKRIAIQLGELAMSDATRAEFQLAHETVHLLDPVIAGAANVLEEGLATYYQLKYIRRVDPNYSTGDVKYDAACGLASHLVTECPGAIKALRSQGKTISTLTAHDLQAACASLSDREATILAQPFREWDGAAR